MAVTFGCPLVGTYNELCGKHLKVGQRAYATDGQSAKPHEGTNWKTGAVDDNGNLIVYENLNWDLDLSNYYTKEEIDAKIFTLACELKENSEVYGGIEPINLSATYAEVYDAYIEGKTIKVIGKFLDRADTLMLDLVGFTNNTFNFSGILSNTSLSLYLNDTNVEVSASDLQLKNNMLTKIEGSENVDSYYPSVKAVADYVAKYGGGDVVIPIISWDEANELLSTGIYRIDNGNATSILISSLLEQHARQILITGDEFSSRHKTKNIETNEWRDWSDWNYFTTSEDFQNAINFVNETLANYYTKEEVDLTIEHINVELNEREFASNKVTIIDEMSIMQGPTYPTAKAVFDFVNDKIGSSENETVVVNLSIGDYETIADKSPSEVYQLYKEGKNVVLSFKYSEYNEASSSFIEREEIYKLIGFIGGNRIIFASQDLHDSLQFTYVTAYMDDDTWDMTKRDDNVEIIDNLESTHTNAALSANQGRVLNEKSETLQQDISDLQTNIVGKEDKSNKVSSGLDLFGNDYHEDVSDDKYPTTKLAHEWAMKGYSLGSVANQRLDRLDENYYTKDEIDQASMQYARVSDLDGFYNKTEIDNKVGDIESALDSILALQSQY